MSRSADSAHTPKLRSISTADEFQKAVTGSKPLMLVVYTGSKTTSITDALSVRLREAAEETSGRVEIAMWDASSTHFNAARATLGFAVTPSIFAVARSQFIDKLEGLTTCEADVVNFAARFDRAVQDGSIRTAGPASARVFSIGSSRSAADTPASPVDDGSNQRMKVDVAKLMNMGKDLMSKGQAFYAEKFFVKAAGVLDALEEQDDEDILGSLAMCLAWQCIAQCVQGKLLDGQKVRERLEVDPRFLQFNTARSDVARAVMTAHVMGNAPGLWNSSTCGEKALRLHLQTEPKDAHARSMLAITLLLGGNLEMVVTEALKLHLMQPPCDFGRTMMEALVRFLGPEDPLVERSGWLQISK